LEIHIEIFTDGTVAMRSALGKNQKQTKKKTGTGTSEGQRRMAETGLSLHCYLMLGSQAHGVHSMICSTSVHV
jgi:hypothetical protein